jgi:hypothetical protein
MGSKFYKTEEWINKKFTTWNFVVMDPDYDIELELEELVATRNLIAYAVYSYVFDGYGYSYTGVIKTIEPSYFIQLMELFDRYEFHPLKEIDLGDLIVEDMVMEIRKDKFNYRLTNYSPRVNKKTNIHLEGPYYIGFTSEEHKAFSNRVKNLLLQEYGDMKFSLEYLKSINYSTDCFKWNAPSGIELFRKFSSYEEYIDYICFLDCRCSLFNKFFNSCN